MHRDPFFNRTVPAELKKLNADDQPEWGSMSASEMLDHLAAGFRVSIENVDDKILTPEDKLPGYRKFLMSDRPFAPNLKAPEAYQKYVEPTGEDMEQAKVNFLKALVAMLSYFEKNPEHTAVHSSFGRLNNEEWLQLHRKHIKHHFTQFGLDP